MAVLNYRLIPAWPEEGRPYRNRRGSIRRRTRRWARRAAKRADERLWHRERDQRA